VSLTALSAESFLASAAEINPSSVAIVSFPFVLMAYGETLDVAAPAQLAESAGLPANPALGKALMIEIQRTGNRASIHVSSLILTLAEM
jgi:hypothetical protein